MRIKEYRLLKGQIETMSGLRIGGSNDVIEIGGVDNPIIRDSRTEKPYIPGSSLKGKMRTLLEWYTNSINLKKKGAPHSCTEADCFICRSFGRSADTISERQGPGRLIFRDCFLTKDSDKELRKLKERKGLNYSEVKTENTINRLSSTANPRQMERVPAGVSFKFELVYRVLDMNDGGREDEQNFDTVLRGLKLLELDGIGGSVSRGYGKICFKHLRQMIGNEEEKLNLDKIVL